MNYLAQITQSPMLIIEPPVLKISGFFLFSEIIFLFCLTQTLSVIILNLIINKKKDKYWIVLIVSTIIAVIISYTATTYLLGYDLRYMDFIRG